MSKRSRPQSRKPNKKRKTLESGKTDPAKQKKRDVTRATNYVLRTAGAIPKPHESYKYRTRHRVLEDGFCVFTLEHPRFQEGQLARLIAEKYHEEFFKFDDIDGWLEQCHELVGEPNRCQIPSAKFGRILDSRSTLYALTVELPNIIRSVLRNSKDRVTTIPQFFPTVLLNKGKTEIQDPHTDWDSDDSDLYSIILAITRTNLAVAVGAHPDELQKNYASAVKRLKYHSLTLEPGEIICFRGNLIHSGGINQRGALRLHWYCSRNPMVTELPQNAVSKVKGIFRKNQTLEPIEKIE